MLSSITRGCIGFSTHRDKWLSSIIRRVTGHQFSHSFIVLDTVEAASSKHIYILEAVSPRVKTESLDVYMGWDTMFEVWAPLEVSEEEIEHALRRTERSFLRKRYSYASLVGIGLTILANRYLGWIIRNPLRMGAWCAEANWHYLCRLMPDLFSWMDHTSVSPASLHHIVSQSGRFQLIYSKKYDEHSPIS